MSFTCKLGFHSWDGCKCTKCIKTRNIQHSWDGCVCMMCGSIKDQDHLWMGCICSKCNTKRNEQHFGNTCKCSKCGKINHEKHDWDESICKICHAIRDIEGNAYTTIQIGKQEWLADNLYVSKFCNGDRIIEVTTKEEWFDVAKRSEPAFCYYNFDRSNGKKYGKLYNWYAVNDKRGLAPKGWHIPTLNEFSPLLLLMEDDPNTLKAISEGDKGAVGTNVSGFSALLGGQIDAFGNFRYQSTLGEFWSSNAHDKYVVHKKNERPWESPDVFIECADYMMQVSYKMFKSYYQNHILKTHDFNDKYSSHYYLTIHPSLYFCLRGSGLSVRCVRD